MGDTVPDFFIARAADEAWVGDNSNQSKMKRVRQDCDRVGEEETEDGAKGDITMSVTGMMMIMGDDDDGYGEPLT